MNRYGKALFLVVAILLTATGRAQAQASIATALSGFCLEVTQGQDVAHTWVRTRRCNGTDFQKFALNGAGEMRAQGNRCIGIWGRGQNWDHIVAAGCNGNRDQKWRIDGHQIKSQLTNRCWDVKDGSVFENGEIQLWDCHWGYNQEFGAFNTNQVVSYANAPLSAGNILQTIVKSITSGGSSSFTMPIGNNLKGAVFPLNGSAPLNNSTPLVTR
jgi:hypothetical protein